MTSPDLDKLLALAEEAENNGPHRDIKRTFTEAEDKFIAAADPTTIKALVEELKYQTERADTWMSIADDRLDEIKELHRRLEQP